MYASMRFQMKLKAEPFYQFIYQTFINHKQNAKSRTFDDIW